MKGASTDPLLLTFEGLNNFQNGVLGTGYVYPPDANGDVGPSHYVQAIHLAVRVFDRTGSPLTSPFLMSSLFADLGGVCAVNNNGRPIGACQRF